LSEAPLRRLVCNLLAACSVACLIACLCGLAGCSESSGQNDRTDEDATDGDLDGESCASGGVSISIVDAQGATPPVFQATLRLPDGKILQTVCGEESESPAELDCTDSGLRLSDDPESLAIVVKARGFRTASAEKTVAYDGQDGDGIRCGHVEVSLSALDAFEANDDYRTGFAADTGRDDFLAMAVLIPGEMGASYAVKFYLENLDSEPNVYFQNTKRHPLHYNFVRGVLGKPLSQQEYERQTYHGESRTAMAGSVIVYSDIKVPSQALGGVADGPFTVEFFPSDDLNPQQALTAYRLLEERMSFIAWQGNSERLFYLPPTESHQDDLVEDEASFRAAGALWLLREELYGDVKMQLLNKGVAYGVLRLFQAGEVENAPVSYKDIALLIRLPNEAPLLGGTITEELQTPLAHVNVAARSRGTPNLALIGASTDPRIQPLIGSLVRFEVNEGGFSVQPATQEEAEAFWAGLIPDEPFVPEADLERTGLLPFAEIGFNDSIAVGVKAANLAELHTLLPEAAPDGFAVPFYYYDRFLRTALVSDGLCDDARDDCLDEERQAAICDRVKAYCRAEGAGRTLATYINDLLADATFRTDTEYREAALDGLRYLIHHIPVDAAFAAQLDGLAENKFGAIDVRLRSSTNAEDLSNFSGAGLYTSISAAVGSGDPPSSRIRKVWSSVWNWRAFEERSFWAIDHQAVKMGVAVHPAYGDEAANGVLITRNLADPAVYGFYVNVQMGETSVTNPVNGALPEIFSLVPTGNGVEIIRTRYSSLSPDVPVMTEPEILSLYQAAQQIQQRFSILYNQSAYDLALDIEFKLNQGDRRLAVKQTRPYFER